MSVATGISPKDLLEVDPAIYSMKDISAYQQVDFLDLAYFAYKREAAGKPVKSQEIWELTVEEMTIGDESITQINYQSIG